MRRGSWWRIPLAVLLLGGGLGTVAAAVEKPQPAWAFDCPPSTDYRVCAVLETTETFLRSSGLSQTKAGEVALEILESMDLPLPELPSASEAAIALVAESVCAVTLSAGEVETLYGGTAECEVSMIAQAALAYDAQRRAQAAECLFFEQGCEPPGESICASFPLLPICGSVTDPVEGLTEMLESSPPGAAIKQGVGGTTTDFDVNDQHGVLLMVQPTTTMVSDTWYTAMSAASIETRDDEPAFNQSRAIEFHYRVTGPTGAPTGFQMRRVYCATISNCVLGIYSSTATMTFAWRGMNAYYSLAQRLGSGSHGTIRDGTFDFGPGSFLANDTLVGAPSSMFDLVGWTYGDDLPASTIALEWQTDPTGVSLQSALDASQFVVPGLIPPDYENPFPGPVAPPEVEPAPEYSPPTTVPRAPPDTNEPVTPAEGEEGWFDALGNRIGGMFDSLASMIGGAFNWLGDLLADLFEKLFDLLRELFEWLGHLLDLLIKYLGGLIGALGQLLGSLLLAIVSALGGLADLIGSLLYSVVAAIANVVSTLLRLPELIGQWILDGLEALFVPSVGVSMPACTAVFPCNWIEEGAVALTQLATIATPGSCEAPVIGFDYPVVERFEVTAPVPSGCSGDVPAGGEPIGDLWGYRVPVRAGLSFFLWASVVAIFIRWSPWGKGERTPLDGLGGGVTVP